VVAPREIILNDFMTYAHISGSNPTPMLFKFQSPPPPYFVKLNFNGASKGNPRPTNYGGVF
jgi:hypothetical protein